MRPPIGMRRFAGLGAALVVGSLVFAGCGSDSGGTPYVAPTGPAIKTLSISAKNFAFTPSALSAPAGILQIDLTSSAGTHDLVIEGLPGFQLEVSGTQLPLSLIDARSKELEVQLAIPELRLVTFEVESAIAGRLVGAELSIRTTGKPSVGVTEAKTGAGGRCVVPLCLVPVNDSES